MMKKLVNLTPHAIVIVDIVGGPAIIPPAGTVARCSVQREKIGTIGIWLNTVGGTHTLGLDEGWDTEVPIYRTCFGAVEGLPTPVPGTLYIVSSLVAQAARERDDLLIPDDTVRDDQGRIIGCRAFARL